MTQSIYKTEIKNSYYHTDIEPQIGVLQQIIRSYKTELKTQNEIRIGDKRQKIIDFIAENGISDSKSNIYEILYNC